MATVSTGFQLRFILEEIETGKPVSGWKLFNIEGNDTDPIEYATGRAGRMIDQFCRNRIEDIRAGKALKDYPGLYKED